MCDVGIGVWERARKLRGIHDVRAGGRCDLFRNLPILERLNQDRFDVLRLHLGNYLREMGWRWRDAGLGLEKSFNREGKAVREIDPRIVVGGEWLAFVGKQRATPILELCVDRRLELCVVRLVACGIRRIDCGEGLRDMLGTALAMIGSTMKCGLPEA